MSGEAVHTFGCGCTADDATGILIDTCKAHDQRTNLVKASAALQQMANALDEAGKAHTGIGAMNPIAEVQVGLQIAAKAAVKAAKALIGAE